jgi:hypothetical protein
VNPMNRTSYNMFRKIMMSMHGAAVQNGRWGMKPVVLRGAHGVGKTECVREVAKLMSLPIIEQRAAQLSDGDLLGIPFRVDGPSSADGSIRFGAVSEFAPPLWVARACVEPVVLFLDELDRAANKSVEQGLFQLADSRRIGNAVLHPRTVVIAAINGGLHESAMNGRYKVSAMDSASLSRWACFDFAPSVEDWMEWATRDNDGRTNVIRLITDFVAANREALDEQTGDIEPGVKTRDRRAWGQLSGALSSNGWCDSDALEEGGCFPEFQSLCMAFLGTDTGTAFAAYARTYSNRLTIDDIERGKFDKSKIDKISPNDKISLAGGILAKYFCNPLTQDVADNMCRFLVSLDLEIAYRALNGKTKEFPFKWNSVKDCGLSKEQQDTQISNVVKTTQQSKWPISGIWAEGYKIEANAKAKK